MVKLNRTTRGTPDRMFSRLKVHLALIFQPSPCGSQSTRPINLAMFRLRTVSRSVGLIPHPITTMIFASSLRPITLLVACGLSFLTHLAAETRVWTSADGIKTFEGQLEKYNKAANEVTIILSGGKRLTFSVEKLSSADRSWLEKQQKEPGKPPESPADTQALLLKDDFNHRSRRGVAAQLLSNKNIHLAEKAGPDGSDAIRVVYVGCARGSDRVTATLPLSAPASAAKLEFDVRFDEDFQWVLGGKLHGLGPANAVTGGERTPPGRLERAPHVRREGRLPHLPLRPVRQ